MTATTTKIFPRLRMKSISPDWAAKGSICKKNITGTNAKYFFIVLQFIARARAEFRLLLLVSSERRFKIRGIFPFYQEKNVKNKTLFACLDLLGP